MSTGKELPQKAQKCTKKRSFDAERRSFTGELFAALLRTYFLRFSWPTVGIVFSAGNTGDDKFGFA
jgi:hypothetical protein